MAQHIWEVKEFADDTLNWFLHTYNICRKHHDVLPSLVNAGYCAERTRQAGAHEGDQLRRAFHKGSECKPKANYIHYLSAASRMLCQILRDAIGRYYDWCISDQGEQLIQSFEMMLPDSDLVLRDWLEENSYTKLCEIVDGTLNPYRP